MNKPLDDFQAVLSDRTSWKERESKDGVKIFTYKGSKVKYSGEQILISEINFGNTFDLKIIFDALCDMDKRREIDGSLRWGQTLSKNLVNESSFEAIGFVCFNHVAVVSGRAFLFKTEAQISDDEFYIVSRSVKDDSPHVAAGGSKETYVTKDSKLDKALLLKDSYVLARTDLIAYHGKKTADGVIVTQVNHADLMSSFLPSSVTGAVRSKNLLTISRLKQELANGWVPSNSL